MDLSSLFVMVWCLAEVLTHNSGLALSCPPVCSCSKNFERISCMGRKLTAIPQNIPGTAVDLYLSNNLLTKIPSHAFVNLTKLETLSLKNNIIISLDQFSFSGLTNLQRLFLTSNKIKSNALQKAIFQGLVNLQRLYLSQNLLTVIPDLRDLTGLRQLGFDNNNIDNASFPVTFESLTNISSVNLAHNPLKSIKKNDLSSLRNSSIAKFDLSHCSLQAVEQDSFTAFKALQSLSLSYNSDLTEKSIENIIGSLPSHRLSSLDVSGSISAPLPASIFQPLSKTPLNNLQMRHTTISTIVNGTFNPLPRLLYLDISYSKLRVVSDDVFSPLVKLRSLDLSNCDLEKFPLGLPGSTSKISLGHNQLIDIIPPGIFEASSQVQTLDLSYCSVKSILRGAFDGLSSLSLLNMSHNQLPGNSIPASCFKSCVKMSVLDLSHNKLTRITTDSLLFDGLDSLISLDLSWNQCSDLPLDIFDPLSALQRLDLRNNDLGILLGTDIKGRLFQSLNKLKWLSLSSNNLKYIQNNTFRSLRNLSELQLDGNLITGWDGGSFYLTNSLEYLNLGGNLIATPTVSLFKYFPAGLHIDMSNNLFNCWCDLIPFREWFDKANIVFLDNQTYVCGSPKQMQGKLFIDFKPASIESKCHPPIWKYATVGAAGGVVLIVILVIIIYIFRWKILLRLYYIKRSCRCTKSDRYEEMHEEYECTLCYGPSLESSTWVKEVLHSKLTKEWDVKSDDIFMDEEDVFFGTGLMKELDVIHTAMRSSRYIVVVIDKDFIKHGKKQLELDMAQECAMDGGLKKKVLPLYFLHSQTEMIELKANVPKTLENKSICYDSLTWTDDEDNQRLFWEQLGMFFINNQRGSVQEA